MIEITSKFVKYNLIFRINSSPKILDGSNNMILKHQFHA